MIDPTDVEAFLGFVLIRTVTTVSVAPGNNWQRLDQRHVGSIQAPAGVCVDIDSCADGWILNTSGATVNVLVTHGLADSYEQLPMPIVAALGRAPADPTFAALLRPWRIMRLAA